MRSPLAVNRPHTNQQAVNWRKGRGKATKNAIRRMHEWLKSAVLVDPIADKRREVLQHLDVFQVEASTQEISEEEKARRAAELKRAKQERDAKEKARKEAQKKANEEKARERQELEKKKKEAAEEEHRKWQEQVRQQEEEENKKKAEEERLKKEKKAQAAQEESARQKKAAEEKARKREEEEKNRKAAEEAELKRKADEEEEKRVKQEQAKKEKEEEQRRKEEEKQKAAAAAEEKKKQEKESKKKDKKSKNKEMSEDFVQNVPVDEPEVVLKKQVDEAAAPNLHVKTESESAATVQDVPLQAASPEESKSSKKNKKNKKHSESEHIEEVRKESVVESTPPAPAEEAPVHVEKRAVETPAAEHSEKKSKKDKKNKKHSESDKQVVETPKEPESHVEAETAPPAPQEAHVEEHHGKKSKKDKKNKRHSESDRVAESLEAHGVAAVETATEATKDIGADGEWEEVHDKKHHKKHGKKDKKHSESEPLVEEKKEAVVEATPPPPELEYIPPANAPESAVVQQHHEEKHDKKSKKNKNKRHSESDKHFEETPAAPAHVEETHVAEHVEEHHEKKGKNKKNKNKKHSESEAAHHEEAKSAQEEPAVAIILPTTQQEQSHEAVPESPVHGEQPAHEEKHGKKNKNKNKKHGESKTNGHVPNGGPVSNSHEIETTAVESKESVQTPAQNDDSLDFLDYVSPKADKAEKPAPTPAAAPQQQIGDSLDFLDYVSSKTGEPVTPTTTPAEPENHVEVKTEQPPKQTPGYAQVEDSLDFLDFVGGKVEAPAPKEEAPAAKPAPGYSQVEDSLDFLDFVGGTPQQDTFASSTQPVNPSSDVVSSNDNTQAISASLSATLMSKPSLFGHSAEKPQNDVVVENTYDSADHQTSFNVNNHQESETSEQEPLPELMSEEGTEKETVAPVAEPSDTSVAQISDVGIEEPFNDALSGEHVGQKGETEAPVVSVHVEEQNVAPTAAAEQKEEVHEAETAQIVPEVAASLMETPAEHVPEVVESQDMHETVPPSTSEQKDDSVVDQPQIESHDNVAHGEESSSHPEDSIPALTEKVEAVHGEEQQAEQSHVEEQAATQGEPVAEEDVQKHHHTEEHASALEEEPTAQEPTGQPGHIGEQTAESKEEASQGAEAVTAITQGEQTIEGSTESQEEEQIAVQHVDPVESAAEHGAHQTLETSDYGHPEEEQRSETAPMEQNSELSHEQLEAASTHTEEAVHTEELAHHEQESTSQPQEEKQPSGIEHTEETSKAVLTSEEIAEHSSIEHQAPEAGPEQEQAESERVEGQQAVPTESEPQNDSEAPLEHTLVESQHETETPSTSDQKEDIVAPGHVEEHVEYVGEPEIVQHETVPIQQENQAVPSSEEASVSQPVEEAVHVEHKSVEESAPVEHAENVHQQEETHPIVSVENTQNVHNEVAEPKTEGEVETVAPVPSEGHPIIVEPAIIQQLPEEPKHESMTEENVLTQEAKAKGNSQISFENIGNIEQQPSEPQPSTSHDIPQLEHEHQTQAAVMDAVAQDVPTATPELQESTQETPTESQHDNVTETPVDVSVNSEPGMAGESQDQSVKESEQIGVSSEQPEEDWADATESFENVSAENVSEPHDHNISTEESTPSEGEHLTHQEAEAAILTYINEHENVNESGEWEIVGQETTSKENMPEISKDHEQVIMSEDQKEQNEEVEGESETVVETEEPATAKVIEELSVTPHPPESQVQEIPQSSEAAHSEAGVPQSLGDQVQTSEPTEESAQHVSEDQSVTESISENVDTSASGGLHRTPEIANLDQATDETNVHVEQQPLEHAVDHEGQHEEKEPLAEEKHGDHMETHHENHAEEARVSQPQEDGHPAEPEPVKQPEESSSSTHAEEKHEEHAHGDQPIVVESEGKPVHVEAAQQHIADSTEEEESHPQAEQAEPDQKECGTVHEEKPKEEQPPEQLILEPHVEDAQIEQPQTEGTATKDQQSEKPAEEEAVTAVHVEGTQAEKSSAESFPPAQDVEGPAGPSHVDQPHDEGSHEESNQEAALHAEEPHVEQSSPEGSHAEVSHGESKTEEAVVPDAVSHEGKPVDEVEKIEEPLSEQLQAEERNVEMQEPTSEIHVHMPPEADHKRESQEDKFPTEEISSNVPAEEHVEEHVTETHMEQPKAEEPPVEESHAEETAHTELAQPKAEESGVEKHASQEDSSGEAITSTHAEEPQAETQPAEPHAEDTHVVSSQDVESHPEETNAEAHQQEQHSDEVPKEETTVETQPSEEHPVEEAVTSVHVDETQAEPQPSQAVEHHAGENHESRADDTLAGVQPEEQSEEGHAVEKPSTEEHITEEAAPTVPAAESPVVEQHTEKTPAEKSNVEPAHVEESHSEQAVSQAHGEEASLEEIAAGQQPSEEHQAVDNTPSAQWEQEHAKLQLEVAAEHQLESSQATESNEEAVSNPHEPEEPIATESSIEQPDAVEESIPQADVSPAEEKHVKETLADKSHGEPSQVEETHPEPSISDTQEEELRPDETQADESHAVEAPVEEAAISVHIGGMQAEDQPEKASEHQAEDSHAEETTMIVQPGEERATEHPHVEETSSTAHAEVAPSTEESHAESSQHVEAQAEHKETHSETHVQKVHPEETHVVETDKSEHPAEETSTDAQPDEDEHHRGKRHEEEPPAPVDHMEESPSAAHVEESQQAQPHSEEHHEETSSALAIPHLETTTEIKNLESQSMNENVEEIPVHSMTDAQVDIKQEHEMVEQSGENQVVSEPSAHVENEQSTAPTENFEIPAMEGVKIIGGEQSESGAHHDEIVESEELGHDKLEPPHVPERAEYTPPGGETLTENTISTTEGTPIPELDASATAQPVPWLTEIPVKHVAPDATPEQAAAVKAATPWLTEIPVRHVEPETESMVVHTSDVSEAEDRQDIKTEIQSDWIEIPVKHEIKNVEESEQTEIESEKEQSQTITETDSSADHGKGEETSPTTEEEEFSEQIKESSENETPSDNVESVPQPNDFPENEKDLSLPDTQSPTFPETHVEYPGVEEVPESHNAPEQYVCISPSFEHTNNGVNLERTNESHLEFVYNNQGKSETVSQEYDTVVTVIVTEAEPEPEHTSVAPPSAPEHAPIISDVEEPAFTKVITDVVNAAAPQSTEATIQKEEADTTHGKSKNKKKNKKNRNTKSITETNPPEITIAELDKHADAEVAAVNAGNTSPPIQVHEISSTEEKVSNGHADVKQTVETIIASQHVNQKDVSPTRFAQNVQSLVEKTLKQAHPGVEIDPNVKMQIDVQLQRLAERRPVVVEARNVITPLPLEVHFSRPTVAQPKVLQKSTPMNRERQYKLLPKDIIFCSGLIDAHGDNYNAMASDPRNIYRENARGLQRKIRIFKESPHYQTYLKAKEEGVTVEALLATEAH